MHSNHDSNEKKSTPQLVLQNEAVPSDGNKELLFFLARNDYNQTLKIRYQAKDKIIFDLMLDGKCNRHISGEASNKYANMDSGEIDEDDETGDAYPSAEFSYTAATGCFIAIRVAAGNHDRVKIKEADCHNTCFFLPDMMKRVQSQ